MKDLFPKNPFILVLGTSHTHGSCKLEESNELQDHERWTGILKSNIDYDVFNVAVPGNSNQRMIQQLNDCFELGVMNNCVMVIAEARTGGKQGEICLDQYYDLGKFDIGDKHNNPIISSGSDIKYKCVLDRMLVHYAAGKVSKPGYYEGLLSIPYEDNPPKQAVIDLKNYIQMRNQFYHSSVHCLIDDLHDIRAMKNIVVNAGIKFGWFGWDHITGFSLSDKPIDQVVDYFKTHTDLFDYLLYQGICLKDNLGEPEEWMCECMHFNAIGHKEISKLIIPEVRKCLNK